jgi:hypothetical protein
VHVGASNLNDPIERQSAEIPVTVEALRGAALQLFPPTIGLPRPGVESPSRNVASLMAANYGDVALEIAEFKVSGPDAALFTLQTPPSVPLTLVPGDARLLRIEYQSRCDNRAWQGHRATLDFSTDGRTLSVPLRGTADCVLALP